MKKTVHFLNAFVLIAALLLSAVTNSPALAQGANQPPIFQSSSLSYTSFQEDTSNNGQVIATDAEGDTLTYEVLNAPSHGYVTAFNTANGSFTYRPYEDYNGADTLRVRVKDPTNAWVEADVSITVQPVSDAPIANDDGVYTVSSPTYNWVELNGASGVTERTSGLGTGRQDGKVAEDINPGFLLPYYNGLYDRMRIYTNGSVELYNSTGTYASILPSFMGYDPAKKKAVVGLSGDKYTDKSTTKIYTKATSTTQFVVEFVNILDGVVPNQPSTFEMIFNKDGTITLQYQAVNGIINNVGLASPLMHQHNKAGNNIPGVYLNRQLVARARNTAFLFTPAQPYKIAKNTTLNATLQVSANDINPDGTTGTTWSITRPAEYGTVTLNADQTFSYTPNTNFVGIDSFTYGMVKSDGKWMEADVYMVVTDASQTAAKTVTTSMKIWVLGCSAGRVFGYQPAGNAMRYSVSGDFMAGIYLQIAFFHPETGEFLVCTKEAATSGSSATLKSTIETQAGKNSAENVAASFNTGTIVSSDGIFKAASTTYTAATLPWDELSGDSGATDLAATIPASSGQEDYYDESGFNVPLGFTFPFHGQNYTTVYPSTNGFLSFGTDSYAGMGGQEGLPLWNRKPGIYGIGYDGYVNWPASETDTNPKTHIYSKTFYKDPPANTQPDRYVLEFYKLGMASAKTRLSTFEIVLFADGKVETRYKTVDATANVVGIQYNPAGGMLDGDLPDNLGLNYPAWGIQSNQVLTYTLDPYYNVAPGSTLNVSAANGLRSNDTSITANATDAVTLAVKVKPLHGTLTLNQDGSFAYTANSGYTGKDYFTYTATLNSTGMASPALVMINVADTTTPQPPQITSIDGARTVREAETVGLTVHATDANGDAIKYSYSVPAGVTLTGATLNADTGAFSWPNAVPGTYDITFRAYQVNDASQKDEQVVTVTVTADQPPVIDSISGSATVDEGQAVSLTVNAHDPDGDALTYELTANNSGGTFNASTHVFSWATGEANNGSYSLTFKVSETSHPGKYATQTVALTVNEVNETPVISGITGSTTVDEGQTISLTVNATQADGQALTYAIDSTDITSGASINASTGVFTWNTTEADNGTHHVTFRVYETNHTDIYALSQTLTLTVNEVNELPVITSVDGSTIVDEGQTLSLTVKATQADAEALSYAIDSTDITSGASINASTDAFTWNTTEADNGSHWVIFKVFETNHTSLSVTSQKITLTVNEVNEPPVISSIDGPTSVREDTAVQLKVIASQADQKTLAYTVTYGSPAPTGATFNTSTGVFDWTHPQPGTYSLTFEVHETENTSLKDTQAFTLTVTADQAPVIDSISGSQTVNEGQSVSLTLTAHDPDGDALTYEMTGDNKGGSFNASTHVFSWATTEADNGSYSLTFKVYETSHTAKSATQTVTLTVNEVNEPPVISRIDGPVSARSGEAVQLKVIASQADQLPLTYKVTYGNPAPTGATFDTATGVLDWSSAAAGTYNMTFEVYETGDASLKDTEAFTLTITELDHAPLITGVQGSTTVDEGQTVSLLVQASDQDNDTLKYEMTGDATGGTFDPSTHTFTWATTEASDGVYHLTFKVSEVDHPDMSDSTNVTLTVNEVNEPPVISSIDGPATAREDDTVQLKVIATQQDQKPLMYAVTYGGTAPAGATFNTTTGVFDWAHVLPGTYPMTFKAYEKDATTISTTQDFTLTVSADQAPVIDSITGSQTVDERQTVTLTVNAHDPDGDPLTYELSGDATGGTFDVSTHIFNWVTGEANDGIYNLTFKVYETNHTGKAASQTVKLTVNEVNEPPVISSINGPTSVTTGQAVKLSVIASQTDNLPLTYAATFEGGTPAGVTFNTATGVLDWANTATGTYNITFEVHETNNAALKDTRAFTLTVTPHQVPVIDSITGVTEVNEGQPLVFTVTAHDPEGGTLAYSLTGVPAGADAAWAANKYTWNTKEADGQGTYSLTFKVVANNDPARTATQVVSVKVNEINQAPVLNLKAYDDLPNKLINAADTVSFTATAADADLPENTLTYSLVCTAASGCTGGVPAGAQIGAASGIFTWTPTADQIRDESYTFQIRVTDSGPGQLWDEKTVIFTVNAKPVFGNTTLHHTVKMNQELAFTLVATDPDNKPGLLEYGVKGTLPTGAVLNPDTGEFTWTPTDKQTGEHTITFTVTDGLATAEIQMTITVEGKIRLFMPMIMR